MNFLINILMGCKFSTVLFALKGNEKNFQELILQELTDFKRPTCFITCFYYLCLLPVLLTCFCESKNWLKNPAKKISIAPYFFHFSSWLKIETFKFRFLIFFFLSKISLKKIKLVKVFSLN